MRFPARRGPGRIQISAHDQESRSRPRCHLRTQEIPSLRPSRFGPCHHQHVLHLRHLTALRSAILQRQHQPESTPL
jgi:hypothetical protein